RGALLKRGEPVDGVTDDRAAAECADCDDHVFVFAAAAKGRACIYGDVALLTYPGCEVDVVCRQVFDDSDVSYAAGEWTLAPCRNLVDIAQHPFRKPGAHGLQRWVVPLDMANATDQP